MEPVSLPLLEAGPGAGCERSPDAAAMAVPQTSHGSGAGGWTFHLTAEHRGQGTGQWLEGWGRADHRGVECRELSGAPELLVSTGLMQLSQVRTLCPKG